ncbi:TIR domain-containing protein [Actinokineospora diospyrosa]|uniref:WD40 repeat n=1 Tax=Actinokineospora diospyrosa TaxID=103728 RepID=A0ABT1I648_9PSEU|nr:TIR domain-containing protein [Actinokineospora diospyrosa]MCP2268098.1 WD40 repeat [Actinokineospora diospyrosa]
MSPVESDVAQRLAEARRRQGWPVARLATECARLGADGLDGAAITAIEAGTRGATPGEVSVLAVALGVAVTELAPEPTQLARSTRPSPPVLSALPVPPAVSTSPLPQLPNPRASVRGPRPPRSGSVDFFISYSLADDDWATWIAHELEAAGYSVMIQAWDFVPGTHFLDFIDRGIRESSALIAVLSHDYMRSQYGRLEWMAALQAAHDHPDTKLLLPVRVENIFPDGLLAPITFVDLVGIDDPESARARLLGNIEHALTGRAKPGANPRYPGTAAPQPEPPRESIPAPRREHAKATFPPTAPTAGPRHELGVLFIPGPRFGAGGENPVDRLATLDARLTHLGEAGLPAPELVIVSGSLTDSGTREQFEQARGFLTGLRSLLGIDAGRLVIVPGGGDITGPACEAYFAQCRAESIDPEPPYFSKWLHFERLHREIHPSGTVFDANQPWSLIELPDLRVAVAALNSTVVHTHLTPGQPGHLGAEQLAWFSTALAAYEQAGYLRIGVVGHTPSARGAAALDDAEAFDAVLGDHLNLLLTGEGSGTAEIEPGPGGLAVIPPRGGPRLLHLTGDGAQSWSLDDTPRRVGHTERPWREAGQAFTAPSSAGPQFREPPARSTDDEYPVDQLLRRITEVIEVRHPRAAVRRLPGRPPVLRVSYPDGDVVPQFLIAAHIGEPTAAEVAALARVRRRNAEELISELVYQGPTPGLTLRSDALRDGVRVRSFTEFQGLLDLRGYVAAQTERLAKDRVYPPELYVPQRFRETAGTAASDAAVREDVVEELLELLSADEGRFVLLMGDFGRGKTFAMRTLAMTLPSRLPGVTPILIELHALDKAHSVDGLVAAHLANHGESRIDLRAFRYLLREGRVVLLFDGFDELASRVSYDRAADHLTTLLSAAEGRAKVVVTSRTQHFQNDAQVRTALGALVGALAQRRILLLEDFSQRQIDAYLLNRYGADEQAARERVELIGRVDDLGGLSRNPRMLSFVAGLDPERLAAVAARDTISAAGLYEEILTSWLAHEHRRAHPPGAQAGLTIDELRFAVTTLALRVWESNDVLLRLDDVAEVAEALAGLADTPLSPPQATHAVGAGSLLVRTDDDLFGFIHASVMEWLVAKEIARQLGLGDGRPALLGRRKLSQLTVDFLCDLGDPGRLREWAARPGGDPVTDANALKISKRLRTPAKTDMREAVLRGEDLSHRDLSGVDLTGADLTDALLIGTKLARATLRGARLRRARLDRAVLRDADLSGADLTGARLAETDLRGVLVTGSTWTRAALINVVADPALRAARELRAAAITPGQPVLTGLRPAGVGVQFGFEDGRLPRPLAYSPDGSLLAVGSGDGGVLLCDTEKGLPLRTLNGHLDRVYAVDFGPPDSALITVAADGTVRFWDPATGEPGVVIADGAGHTAPVWPLRISPDGAVVAYGDGAGEVIVRSVPGGEQLHRLGGHVERVWAVAFHPGGTLLATADESGVVRLWDLATGTERHRFASPGAAVYTLDFSPDGRLLVVGGQHAHLRLLDVDSGTEAHRLEGHTGHVYAATFHPELDVLATGDISGAVRLWKIPPTGRPTSEVLQHRHATNVYHLAFSPDGRTLASGDSDGTVRVWDTTTGQETYELAAHRGAVWPLAFRADSAQLATTGRDGTVRLWDPVSGRQRFEVHGHGRRVTQVHFNPAGDLLAAAGNDGVVRVWDPVTGRRLQVLTGRGDQLTGAVFNPVKPLLATASNDGGMHLWQLSTWHAGQEVDVETEYVWASAFSPDGEVLATANDDDTVRLWWQATGREVLVLLEHRGRVRSIVFSPDGSLVATGCDDSKVRLFDRETGACLATLEGHTDRVYDVRFSADGQVLASVSNDGTAVLWRVADHALVRVFTAQRGRLWAGAFSQDGRVLAVAGDDAVIYLWDTATGTVLARLSGHTRRVLSLAFSPDGRTLASGAADGTTRLWDVAERRLRLTMIGLPEAWAAVTPEGRYKVEGAQAGEFWHAVGLCRFEVGELDGVLREARAVPLEEPF